MTGHGQEFSLCEIVAPEHDEVCNSGKGLEALCVPDELLCPLRYSACGKSRVTWRIDTDRYTYSKQSSGYEINVASRPSEESPHGLSINYAITVKIPPMRGPGSRGNCHLLSTHQNT